MNCSFFVGITERLNYASENEISSLETTLAYEKPVHSYGVVIQRQLFSNYFSVPEAMQLYISNT